MCMVEYCDDYVMLLRNSHHKATKQHACCECRRTIAAGETYMVETVIFDGERSGYKTCAHCEVARNWLQAECGGFLYRGVYEDIKQHADSGHYGFGVRKLAVGMAARWARKSGSAWPTPRLPKTTHQESNHG